MRATNKDILGFYFEPPDIHGVRKLKAASRDDAEKLFGAHAFYKPMQALERGWLYGYLNAGDFSAFISLGRDAIESRLFHELRLNGKSHPIGEHLCDAVSESQKLLVREKEMQLDWSGSFPDYSVTLWLESGEAKAEFRYKFEKLSDQVGPYRCVADVLGNRLAYFYVCPVKASLNATIEGDYEKIGISKELYDRINGKEITSLFAYNESVRLNAPLISGGWHWHVLSCYEDNPAKPVKAVGFMDLFYESGRKGKENERTIINLQFYCIDLESGAIELYTDAEATMKTKDGRPFFSIITDDGEDRKSVV